MAFEAILFFMALFVVMIYKPILALALLVMVIIFIFIVGFIEIAGYNVGWGDLGLGIGNIVRREEHDVAL